jgi:hypothetical protein
LFCLSYSFEDDTWNIVLTESIPNLIDANPADFQLTLIDELFDQLFTFPEAITPSQVALFVVNILHRVNLQEKTLSKLEKYMEDKDKVSDIEEKIRNDRALGSISSRLLSILKIE